MNTDRAKKVAEISVGLAVSFLILFLFFGATLRILEFISLRWEQRFPNTELLFLPFSWTTYYLHPAFCVLLSGAVASLINRSHVLSILIAVMMACFYFITFSNEMIYALNHIIGTLAIGLCAYCGHCSGIKLFKRVAPGKRGQG